MPRIILTLVMSLLMLSQAHAYTDPYLCAKYDKSRLRNVEKVLAVGILKVNDTSVETYVLGFGTPVKASLNRIALTDKNILKRRALQCKGVTVGHMRIYSLEGLGVETGEFVIKSGNKRAATFIEID